MPALIVGHHSYRNIFFWRIVITKIILSFYCTFTLLLFVYGNFFRTVLDTYTGKKIK